MLRSASLFLGFALLGLLAPVTFAEVISPIALQPGQWQFYSLDLSTAPVQPPLRAVIQFTTDSNPDDELTVLAQFDTQPNNQSFAPFTQFDSSMGSNGFNYFGALSISTSTGTLYFGIYNKGNNAITVASGRYNFAVEQHLPRDLFALQEYNITIQAGTEAFFVLPVPEATELGLFLSLKFTTLTAFQSEISRLFLRRNSLPNIASSEAWGVINYQSDAGSNSRGQRLAGWEAWFRKRILAGTYYVSLFNPDPTDHSVYLKTYLTQIFSLEVNTPININARAGKNNVFTYTTDAYQRTKYLQVNVETNGGQPAVRIKANVCPTQNDSQSFSVTRFLPHGRIFFATTHPNTSYCIVAQNINPTGTYSLRVSVQETSNTDSGSDVPQSGIVQTDEYGDGLESIEVAGIVLGIFIGIFAAFFVVCFFLTLLQIDRNYWYNADPLSHDNAAL